MPDAAYSLLAAGNVHESDSVAPGNAAVVMEEVITYYLKSRNVKYPDDPSHCELLLPLVSLGFTKGDMYNCFYTLLSKYIPRWVEWGKGGKMRGRRGGEGREGEGSGRGREGVRGGRGGAGEGEGGGVELREREQREGKGKQKLC